MSTLHDSGVDFNLKVRMFLDSRPPGTISIIIQLMNKYFSHCKFQVSHQKVKMIDRCTKFNFQEYWCPVKSDLNKNSSTYLSHGLRSGRPFPWGICDMSCMENFNKSSVVLTMEISPELMNSMTIAEEVDEDTTYKGQISDLYIWDRYIFIWSFLTKNN